MKYQNIIFDFGNVLVKFDAQQVIGRFCPAPEDFSLMKGAIFHNWEELDRGTIDYGEYMEQAASLLPKRLHPFLRQISLEWCRYLSPLQKTWDFISELKEQGFSLYILSNASIFFAEHIDCYEITREFDGIVFSGYPQMMKPEPDIYRYLFDKYQLNPKNCFFLDDKAENVNAGQKLGMDGIVFTGDIQAVRQAIGF